jgi:hypothetical protein
MINGPRICLREEMQLSRVFYFSTNLFLFLGIFLRISSQKQAELLQIFFRV